jgi:hypothetical protein
MSVGLPLRLALLLSPLAHCITGFRYVRIKGLFVFQFSPRTYPPLGHGENKPPHRRYSTVPNFAEDLSFPCRSCATYAHRMNLEKRLPILMPFCTATGLWKKYATIVSF